MSTAAAEPTALNGYQLRLPGFEGPLDVLLRLIERDQLAITDVSLVAVTDQFLAHLATLDEAPVATIAEFAAVGGRLVLLKSRSLLPRPPAATDEPEPEDLVRQLSEYRAMQAAARHLAERDRLGGNAFARGEGVVLPESPPARLALHRPSALARALRRRLTAAPDPQALVDTRPLVTLREMTERVLTALTGRPSLGFRTILARCGDRQETLTAFLAVLVLVRRRVVDAEQGELFGEITLRRAVPTPLAFNAPTAGEAADD